MSIRNLDQLFDPASVAVFGASQRPASVGARVWANVRGGGFKGLIHAVNPKHRALSGQAVFARAADLPSARELALICTPPATVAGLIDELGALGTRAAVVLTSGLGPDQKMAMLAAARPHLLRILGPGCVGLLAPHIGLNASVAHTDAAAHAGVTLATLGEATRKRLDAVLPAKASNGNPVHIAGDAPVGHYLQALQALLDDTTAGAVLFIQAPSAMVQRAEIARAMAPLAAQAPPRLMVCWLGEAAVAEARRSFQDAGIAGYPAPEDAERAFSMLVTYRHNQAQLMEAPTIDSTSPSSTDPSGRAADMAAAHALAQQVLDAGRLALTEPEAKAMLGAYGMATVATRSIGPQPRDAAIAAETIGFPVALKVLSPDLAHEADVGGVALNLDNAIEVRDVAQSMLRRVQLARPDAQIEGFTVQAMVQRSHAQAWSVGAGIDKVFGPVILFGQGGTAAAVVADRAVALPPLNTALARALIERTRVARQLEPSGDKPAADQAALHAVLVAVSQLLADMPQVAALDINPLIVNQEGAIALEARIRLSAEAPAGARNFAIRPCPAQLVETTVWQGRRITLRPIRPEDEAQHQAFLGSLDPTDVRLRVSYSRRSIARSELARLTQIDYEREMASVTVAARPDGVEQTLEAHVGLPRRA